MITASARFVFTLLWATRVSQTASKTAVASMCAFKKSEKTDSSRSTKFIYGCSQITPTKWKTLKNETAFEDLLWGAKTVDEQKTMQNKIPFDDELCGAKTVSKMKSAEQNWTISGCKSDACVVLLSAMNAAERQSGNWTPSKLQACLVQT